MKVSGCVCKRDEASARKEGRGGRGWFTVEEAEFKSHPESSSGPKALNGTGKASFRVENVKSIFFPKLTKLFNNKYLMQKKYIYFLLIE